MKEIIRQRLLEALKSRHWAMDSYPDRIEDVEDQLGAENKAEIDRRIAFIETLEFANNKSQKLGVWVFSSPKVINTKEKPGSHLLAIINGNMMTTLYWKHIKDGEYNLDIDFEELLEFSKSDFYDPEMLPIDIGSIESFRESKKQKPKVKRGTPKPNLNRFKKIKLNDGQTIRYYELLNKFETLEGQPLNVDDIFDLLPDELQDKVMELLENRK